MVHYLARSFLNRSGKGDEDDSENGGLPMSEPKPPQRIPTLQRHEQEEADCNIQPHTDAGGDAYYIGDAYEPAKLAQEWALRDS